MLEPRHSRTSHRPNVYPYNTREDGFSKNRTKCPPIYQQDKGLIKPEQAYIPGGPSLTGEHVSKNRYNSASWRTENQVRYKVIDFSRVSPDKTPFLLTTLDSKRHTPQSKNIFHIHRVNQKPICSVQSWPDDPKDMDKKDKGTSIYMTSFKERPFPEITKVVNKNTDRRAEGIVPFNLPAENLDVRSEMMLPVCETTRIPSAPHPHKYLLRRRKVPPQFQSYGIFYNNNGEPIQTQSEDRPLSRPPPMNDNSSHVSITSLCGKDFTRRRYIAPPSGILAVTNFDGGAKAIGSTRFDEKYLPFIRAKSVI